MGSCDSLQCKIFVMGMPRNLGEREYKNYRLLKKIITASQVKKTISHASHEILETQDFLKV